LHSPALEAEKVLIVFYPGDDTPVCTAQLCDYRNNVTEFTKRGIAVLGISADSPESHKKFAAKKPTPLHAAQRQFEKNR